MNERHKLKYNIQNTVFQKPLINKNKLGSKLFV